MEVTHIERLDNHAFIGATGKAELFSMAQSAEMYQMLTSTLYSNEKVAFVREVLCNAWDAHIEAGKTNVPIEVTIDTNEVVFRDRGNGIPKRRMGRVYGTYGESTKTKDEAQTGGFGLGSKSPLAYTTNFSVTTEHGGVKTAFNISRGTEASHGIPIMQEILSTDTTETGLTVSIPLEKQKDAADLTKIIKNVARFGNILITLNGAAVERLNYELAEKDRCCFIGVPTDQLPDYLPTGKQDQYYVKIGGVVYPISEEMCQKYILRTKFHKAMQSYGMRFILIAKPSSMGIVPSREALKYTEATIAALKDLAKELDGWMDRNRDYAVNIVAKKVTEHTRNTMKSDLDHLYMYLRAERRPFGDLVDAYYGSYYNHGTKFKDGVCGNAQSKEYLAQTMVDNRAEKKEVEEILRKWDPEQNMLRQLAFKMLRKTYKGIMPQFFKAKSRKDNTFQNVHRNRTSFTKVLNTMLVRRLVDYMEHVQKMFGVDTYLYDENAHRSGTHDDEGFTLDQLKYVLRHDQYCMNSIAEGLYKRKRPIFDMPVIVTPSQAAFKRVARKHTSEFMQPVKQAFKFVSRDKTKHEAIKKHFTEFGATHVMDIAAYDVKPKPVMCIDKLWLLSWNKEEDTPHITPRRYEHVEHFIYMPYDRMIPGLPKGNAQDGKIRLDVEVLRAISYLFPHLVIAPTSTDAAEMEKNGLVNVFKVIADEAEEFLNQDSSFEKYLPYVGSLTGHAAGHGIAMALGTLEPRQLLEVFGIETDLKAPKDHVLPTIVEIYLAILEKQYAPKYGVQYCQAVAKRFTERFQTFFGPYSRVLESYELQTFVNHFPVFEQKKPQKKLLFQTALMAVIQHLMVQHKLSQMEKPDVQTD